MTSAILWKELREQGPIGLALMVLGSGVLALAATQGRPAAVDASMANDVLRLLGPGPLATLMLAVTAGMVCGGAVFASEREAGTMLFLETLPVTHWRLWKAKLLAGGSLAVAQAAVLLVVAGVFGQVPTASWAAAVLLYALLAFVWGLFGSTAARTTLGSVGYAIPTAAVFAFVAAVPVMLFFHRPGTMLPRPRGGLLFLAVMFAAPLYLSAYMFTRTDRERTTSPNRRPPVGTSAMLWLGFRQYLVPGLVIGAFALVLGLGLLAPDAHPFVLWPAFALAAGSLTGVLAFADEQIHGSARFWAEQRLPLGRVWTVKIAVQLGLCLGLLLVLSVPLIVHGQFHPVDFHGTNHSHAVLSAVFGTQVFDQLGGEGWNYLLFPAAYGLAAGHVCGLLFRKLVVAWAVAALVGGTAAMVWLPSLLAGGVRVWQLWLPPAIALATGRLVLRAWAADQLLTRRPLATLAAGALAALLVQAAGIGYRVLELPDRADGEADVAYVAGLMTFEDNISGRDFKTAAERFAVVANRAREDFDKSAAQPPPPAPQNSRLLRLEERLELVLRVTGWSKADVNLGAWLDRVFEKPPGPEDAGWQWWLASAAGRPPGIYEHPQMIGSMSGVQSSTEEARRMSFALLARGLQQQARGDLAAFAPAFHEVIMLVRTMRNGSVLTCLEMGNEIERYALWTLDRWLEGLEPADGWLALAPTALAPAGAALNAVACGQFHAIADLVRTPEEADPQAPFDPTPQYLAERHVIREALRAPTYSLPPQLGIPVEAAGPSDPVVDLIALAWAVPWEKERTRRLVGLGFESGARYDAAIEGRPGKFYLMLRPRAPADLIARDTQLRASRRAALLKLGLTAYRQAAGVYPKSLAALLEAGFLSRLPVDPYKPTQGFGYRVSAGETLRSLPRAPQERSMMSPVETLTEVQVPAGQAILWSLGPGGIDYGGTNPPPRFDIVSNYPGNVTFLVPLLGRVRDARKE